MGKDHSPGTFNRPGYESDIETAEQNAYKVNTSFGSWCHNVYIINQDGSHEHFFYDPMKLKSGWHGNNFPTRNNHPAIKIDPEGREAKMSDKERHSQFVEQLRADYNQHTNTPQTGLKTNSAAHSHNDNGGRERSDDDGPGRQGRESGNKSGETTTGQSNGLVNTTTNISSRSSSVNTVSEGQIVEGENKSSEAIAETNDHGVTYGTSQDCEGIRETDNAVSLGGNSESENGHSSFDGSNDHSTDGSHNEEFDQENESYEEDEDVGYGEEGGSQEYENDNNQGGEDCGGQCQ